jgi:hypothetical protein
MQFPKAPDDVKRQVYNRYGDLVDKKFCTQLSPDEQEELRGLSVYLDETEAELYKPIEHKLELILAMLRQSSSKR